MSLNCANHPQTEALVVHDGNSLCKECYERYLKERNEQALAYCLPRIDTTP